MTNNPNSKSEERRHAIQREAETEEALRKLAALTQERYPHHALATAVVRLLDERRDVWVPLLEAAEACLEDLPSGDLYGASRYAGASQRSAKIREAIKAARAKVSP